MALDATDCGIKFYAAKAVAALKARRLIFVEIVYVEGRGDFVS